MLWHSLIIVTAKTDVFLDFMELGISSVEVERDIKYIPRIYCHIIFLSAMIKRIRYCERIARPHHSNWGVKRGHSRDLKNEGWGDGQLRRDTLSVKEET